MHVDVLWGQHRWCEVLRSSLRTGNNICHEREQFYWQWWQSQWLVVMLLVHNRETISNLRERAAVEMCGSVGSVVLCSFAAVQSLCYHPGSRILWKSTCIKDPSRGATCHISQRHPDSTSQRFLYFYTEQYRNGKEATVFLKLNGIMCHALPHSTFNLVPQLPSAVVLCMSPSAVCLAHTRTFCPVYQPILSCYPVCLLRVELLLMKLFHSLFPFRFQSAV